MKSALFFLVFFIGSISFAQSYTPMIRPSGSSSWSGFGFDIAPPPDNASWTIDFHSGSDTVIGNQNYTSIDYYPHDHAYYLREDSVGKVFVRGTHDSIEHLLYDFSMQVGDSINDTLTGYKVTVTYVDSFLTPLGNMKRLHINGSINDVWIESVGGSQILSPFRFSHFEDAYCLREMSNHFTQMYLDTDCQQYPLAIYDVHVDKPKLYPVPAIDILLIKWDDSKALKRQGTILIRNILGQYVLSKKIQDNSKNNISINLDGITDGVYLADWVNNDGIMQTLGKFTVVK